MAMIPMTTRSWTSVKAFRLDITGSLPAVVVDADRVAPKNFRYR